MAVSNPFDIACVTEVSAELRMISEGKNLNSSRRVLCRQAEVKSESHISMYVGGLATDLGNKRELPSQRTSYVRDKHRYVKRMTWKT